MKKILLLFVIMVLAYQCPAQTWQTTYAPAVYTLKKNPEDYKVHFRGSVDAGFRFGSNPFIGRYGVTVTVGISAGNYFYGGLGTGYFYYTQRQYKQSGYMPIFLNLGTNLTKGKHWVPYLDANVGYSTLNSLFIDLSAGLKYKLENKNAIRLSVGYNYEKYYGGLDRIVELVQDGYETIQEEHKRPNGDSYFVDVVVPKMVPVELEDVREKLKGFVFKIGFEF